VVIGRAKAGVLGIDEQCNGCGVLERLNGPERNEMGELWLEIGIDPENKAAKRRLILPWEEEIPHPLA
jgi:hypothetical protein